MADSKSYLIISSTPKPDNQEQLHSYLSQAMPLAMAAGGKPIGRYVTTKQLVGEGGPTLVAVVEFPDEKSITDMMASAEFTALADLRNAVFENLDMVICAEM